MEKNKAEEPLESYGRPLNADQVWELFRETDRKMKETDRKMKETDQKIKKLSELFTSQWGRLIESLVEGDLVQLLNERGIRVDSVLQRRRGHRDGHNYEFDLIAVNTDEIVIVEVKTTLRPDDVKDFLEKLQKAKIFMPEYKSMKAYGGMAFITADAGSETMAEKKGLFVIRATGSSAAIINASQFIPKVF